MFQVKLILKTIKANTKQSVQIIIFLIKGKTADLEALITFFSFILLTTSTNCETLAFLWLSD